MQLGQLSTVRNLSTKVYTHPVRTRLNSHYYIKLA